MLPRCPLKPWNVSETPARTSQSPSSTSEVVSIYGVLSQTVTQRTREIGLRLALGAKPGETFRWFVGNGMKMVLLGVTIGVVSAFGLTRFVSSMLYGIQPTDTIAMSSAVGVLLVVALVASYLPTRRALRVDPMLTLRGD